jgi:signal transduction histidine kinase
LAEGGLDTRLSFADDPDLDRLVTSFNDMADAVQERIVREQRFASDVSHELRTPLTAMLSSVQIARRRAADPVAIDEALAELEERSDEFRALVLDLLEISRMDAGVAEVTLEEIDPEQLVRAVLRTTGNDDVPVTVTPPDGTPIRGDKRRLGQVLQNLLENARRYGGGPTLVAIQHADDTLTIAVEDEGPGVPEHERTFIFNRFSRGQAGIGSSTGSGLGLALAAEHLRLHGGTIAVTRSAADGARFEVVLPLAGPTEEGT